MCSEASMNIIDNASLLRCLKAIHVCTVKSLDFYSSKDFKKCFSSSFEVLDKTFWGGGSKYMFGQIKNRFVRLNVLHFL